jgi:hypothetical protein
MARIQRVAPDSLVQSQSFKDWIYAPASAEGVGSQLVAVEAAVRVELFRQKWKRYPESLTEVPGMPSQELRYELAEGGHGYVISSVADDSSRPVGGVFRVERKSRADAEIERSVPY